MVECLSRLLNGPETRYANMSMPVRFISIEGDDMLAPVPSVESITRAYGNAEHHHITEKIGHFGFFQKNNSSYWTMITEYFEQ